MPKSVFPYPGGKTYLADWIIDKFPKHECYVEVFGGSASILVNKQKSQVEVFNDLDGDIVHFFEVLRDRPDELREWLECVPYSRKIHEEWTKTFYNGERVDDPVERAGRFFFLRRSQFGAKYDASSGFIIRQDENRAKQLVNGVARLSDFSDRLRHVTIEHRNYSKLIDSFDGVNTLFYCDPPYVRDDNLYLEGGEFNHREFVETLNNVEGQWICSFSELPGGLSEYHVIERESVQSISNSNVSSDKTGRTERLVMNYNPEDSTHSRSKSATEANW